MSVVRFGFTPAAAHVRTARLVAAAVARQAGMAGDRLDEVRQAVGEACSRAVARHRRQGIHEPVRIEFSFDASFVVKVTDIAHEMSKTSGTGHDETVEAHDARQLATGVGMAPADEDTLAEEVVLNLLSGLVTDLTVRPGPAGVGSIVQMSWPVDREE